MTEASKTPDLAQSSLDLDPEEQALWAGYGENKRIMMTRAERAAVLATTDPALEGLRSRMRASDSVSALERDAYILAVRTAQEGELEFDDCAVVAIGDDNGAYVSGYSWVSFAGTPCDKDVEPQEAADFAVTKEVLDAAFRSCVRSSRLDGVGGELIFDQIRDPSQMSREVFLCLMDLQGQLEVSSASGRWQLGCTLKDLEPLMDAQPWTLHPDHGCVLKADVEAMGNATSARERVRS